MLLSLLLAGVVLGRVAAGAQFSESVEFPQLSSYYDVPTAAPVVGVLSQPVEYDGKLYTYLAASYVKYAEAGGARVVPVFSDRSQEELRTIFSKLNGLIVPGVR
jgi:gamma-glutamyl hydrolase